jgi:hypothetical protein
MNLSKFFSVAFFLKCAITILILSVALLNIHITRNSVGASEAFAEADFENTETALPESPLNSEPESMFKMMTDEQTVFGLDYEFPWSLSYTGRNNSRNKTRSAQTDTYTLKVKHSGKCLDISGGSNGATAQQWDCHTGDNQKWQLISDGQGYYWLKARHSGKCLDVEGTSTNNGAKTQQWDCHTGNNQKWQLVAAGSGYYQLKAKHSGRCLDITDVSNNNGARVQQWNCHSGDNQKWLLAQASGSGGGGNGGGAGGGKGNFSGDWYAGEWGNITFNQNGNKVNGSYTRGNGAIYGTASGNRLDATWQQGGKLGKAYFIIQSNGTLEGKYCEGDGCNPGNGTYFNGRRR